MAAQYTSGSAPGMAAIVLSAKVATTLLDLCFSGALEGFLWSVTHSRLPIVHTTARLKSPETLTTHGATAEAPTLGL